jgi:hypothetical protein
MTVESPIHFKIHVYAPENMPPAEPYPVALCPFPGRAAGPLTEDAAAVTCPACRKHIDELGVDWA